MESVMYQCKICGKPFSYASLSIRLRLEEGESEPERCAECRKKHGGEVQKSLHIPFAVGMDQQSNSASRFVLPAGAQTTHGERKRELKQQAPNKAMKFGIVDEDIIRLYEALEHHQVVVFVCSTGSGKSTLIPARLIEPPQGYKGWFTEHLIRQGQIAITQPRIIATSDVAQHGAEVAGAHVGPDQVFGYRHGDRGGSRKGEQWSRNNLVVTITEGTLRNWITEGTTGRYSLVIVDEAHERSTNIDIIIALLKVALQKFPHLRVLISSATIDQEKFVRTFESFGLSTKLLDVQNHKPIRYFGPHCWKNADAYPGCACWFCSLSSQERISFWKPFREVVQEDDLPQVAARFTNEILKRTDQGSIFLFLHGQAVIERTARELAKIITPSTVVVPIYSNLKDGEVKSRLKTTEGKRRVIVATNIGETSITIKDIVYVVDSGFIKEAQWDPSTRSVKLQPKRHSKDGCKQRWGRAGRVQEGFAYSLYTEEEFNQFPDHTAPEITRACAEDVLVSAKAAGLSELADIPWVDSPNQAEIKRAIGAVQSAGLSDAEGDIDPKGLEMMRIPRPVAEAALFAAADIIGCLVEALSVFLLFRTRDEKTRLGENSYTSESPIFLWDDEWSLQKKNEVMAIHEAMRVGCEDDVAFLAKLAHCFWTAQEAGIGNEWAERHFLSYDFFKSVLAERDDLLQKKFGASTHEDRWVINGERLHALRHLIRTMMPGIGLNVLSAKKRSLNNTTLPSLMSIVYPGEWVGVDEEYPSLLYIERWLGTRREKRARVVSLIEEEGKPIALLSPSGDEDIISLFSGRKGEAIDVTIHRIFRDPFGRGGWAQAVTREGDVFLVDLRELSLSFSDHIVEQMKDKELTMVIQGYAMDGLPILSYIPRIIADLAILRGSKGGDRELNAMIVGIDLEKERVTVAVSRPEDILHSFEIHRNYVPGGDISRLQLGEEVLIRLAPTTYKRCQFPKKLNLQEVKTLPVGFVYDEEAETLSSPYALDHASLDAWATQDEIKEEVWRYSWRYAFQAEIIQLKQRVNSLTTGMVTKGTVRSIRQKADNTSASAEVILENGVVGFLLVRDFGDDPQSVKSGAALLFEVLKADMASGSVRLTRKVNPYKSLRVGQRVKGTVEGVRLNQRDQVAGVSVVVLVDTGRGSFFANGFLPARYLRRIPGTTKANISGTGAILDMVVFEIDPDKCNLILQQL
jgi:HrpA-like RNA helicase